MTGTLPTADASAVAMAARLAARLARAKAHRSGSGPAIAPRPDGLAPPLSAAQRRLWFLHQWAPDSAAYTIPVAWRLRGPLEVDRLVAAVQAVVTGNEILRTRYPSVDGEPSSCVDESVLLNVPVVSARTDLDAQIVALAREPFDLARRWPVRAALLRVAPQDHVLVLCLHHIAADGWSIGLLAGQLATAYAGGAPTPTVRYADVTYARREVDHDADLAYWASRLADLPPSLELPGDRPRPAVAGDDGAILAFELDAPATVAVRDWAAASHATTFMCLTAALAALCARYAGVEDVIVGTPVAGRDAAVADVIGCFVNTIVLRTQVAAGITADDLLASVRAGVLSDMEHAALPYEELVTALPGRSGGGGLFTVQVVATNVPRTGLVLDGLTVTELPVDPGAAKLDLSVAIEDLGGPTMPGSLTYRTDVFDADTAARLVAQLGRLVAAMATEPGAPVGDHDLFDAGERALLLAPPARVPATLPTIVDLVAAQPPDRTAVIAADGALTYGDLLDRARGIAADLLADGLCREEPVALDATRDTGFVAGLLGILLAGGAYAPLEPDLPAARRDALMASAGIRRRIRGGDSPDATAESLPEVRGDGLAYIIFTSGSTGTPKGVAVEHGQLMSYVDSIVERIGLPGAAYGVYTTLAADLGHTMVFGALATGGTLHIVDRETATDPEALALRPPVDVAKFVPSHLTALLAGAADGDAAALLPTRCLVLGGEAASWELIDRVRELRPGLRVINHYGPTETTVGALTYEIGPERPPVVPLGRPLPHLAARIVDPAGRPQPIGVPGELVLGGAGVARGYLGDVDSDRFYRDQTGLRCYRTGDRARWRPDGTIEFLGRVDRQVKLRGYRVEPGEIEAQLRAHPDVVDAAVVVEDGRLLGYVAGRVGEPDLWAWCAETLPAHLVPSALVVLPALPLTANGKVDRAALPAVAPPANAGAPPTTRLERLVAGVLAEVLGQPIVSIEDNFFTLGGHSLLATQAVSRLRRAVGVPLTVPEFFAAPTVGGLARRLRGAAGGADAGPTPGSPGGVLSYGQRRLWFLDQAAPSNPAYNLPYVLRLDGKLDRELDVAALRAALNGVIRRHDALRTTFAAGSDGPVPVVADPFDLDLPVADLRSADKPAVRREVDAEFRHGFALATGPLLRARLLRTGDATHLLLLTLHHTVFDGWSLGVLLNDLAAALRGEALPATPITYADYAHWQAAADHSADLDFWTEHLDGAPLRLDLPADRARPARPSYRGDAVFLTIAPDTRAALTSVARGEGATPFMALLAVYQVLLARYAGVEDLIVGTPVAGRDHPDLEPLVGLFVNMVPLRGRPEAPLTFRDFLRQVRSTALAAYAHAAVPFEQIVEQVRPERDPSRAPIFSVMMSLRNTRPIGDLPGLRVSELDGPTGVAKYDLSLVLAEDGGGLRGALEYSTDLFDPTTARRLVDSFEVLLAEVVARPDTRLSELPLLSSRARQQILVEWNETAAPGAAAMVPELVAAQAHRRPDAIALIDDHQSLTFREVDTRANRLSHRLLRLGVGRGTIVAISAERSAEVPVAMLAVLRTGAAYLPLDTAQPAARRDDMLADSGAVVLITDEPSVPFAGAVVDIADPCTDESGHDPGVPAGPTDLAYIIYTSGSTGRPKGVLVEHRSLVNAVAAIGSTVGVGPDDVWLGLATFSFDISGLDLWGTLIAGARVVVVSTATARDGARLARRMAEVGATFAQATPVTWRLLLEAGWSGDPGLTAVTGGEALPPELASALAPRVRTLWNAYGPTEATIWTHLKRLTGPPVTIGRPIANTTAYVLDARLAPVPVGVTGELYLGGVQVARGYHARPELTRERFIPDPYGPAGARLYRTGDLARWRPDGELDVLGRIDTQVKLRGYRIEIGEIETALAAHPDVSAAVVDLRTDEASEPRLVAYVAGGAAAPELRSWLGERLPAYMIPSVFVPIEAVPVTTSGKVDRRALPDPRPDGPPAGASVGAPLTPTQRRVAAEFAAVLGHPDFGPDDDFFAIGGESMRAVRVVRHLDPTLSVLDLFTHPTVRALAAHLDRGAGSEADLLHRLTPDRGRATVSLVCAPFGGGGAIAYAQLAAQAPTDWDVYALQPPGRDAARPDEALMSLPELADACAERVLAEVAGPIVLYGHCVGSALAVELTRRLEAAGRPVLGVVVAGAFPTTRLPGPLDLLARLAPGRRQSDRAVADGLRLLGGLSEELPEAHRAQLARAVRHDAREAERAYTAAYRRGPDRLAAPLLVVVAADDRTTEFHAERAHEWAAFGSSVDVAVIPRGGHFFQRADAAPDLVRALAATVDRWRADEPPAQPPAVPPPARLRAFGIVTLGQLVSLIGSGLTTFALGVWAYQATGAVSAFAAIAAFGLVPAVLAAPVAGAVADRYDRRVVMMWCDGLGLAASTALIGLLWTDQLAIWHLYTMVLLTSVATTFRQPAYLAAVAQLAPKRYLGQANGVVGLGTATGAMVAQLCGGILTVVVGLNGVAWIDLASYSLAMLTLAVVRFPDLAFVRRDGPLVREIVAGWRFLARRRGLVALTVYFAVANALGGVVIVLVTPLVLASSSPAVLGVVLAANGVGLLVGSALMAVWGGTRRRSAGMIGFVALFAVSAIVIGLRPGAALPAVGMFGIGVCAALINAHWLALVQVKVGVDLLGRILATCLMLARTLMPIGYLITGPLVDSVFEPALTRPGPIRDLLGPVIGAGPGRGMAAAVIVTGIVALLWTVAAYRYRPLREADRDLPDADDIGSLPSSEPQHARTSA